MHRKILVFKLLAKMLLANVDMNKKNMAFEANRPLPTFGPKMADPVNFGSAPRIFVKFCIVRRTRGCMKSLQDEMGQEVHKNYINGFSKKCWDK